MNATQAYRPQSGAFTFASPDIVAGGTIPLKYALNGMGSNGGNVSPALEWHNAPAGTKSYSITVYDPDAPTGSGFWHWGVHNIPGSVNRLAEGAGNSASTLPEGAYTTVNDYYDTGVTQGNGNWGGPCPPVGDPPHHYIFTLYALDTADLPATAQIPRTGTPALHGFALNKLLGAHVLGKATFMATYSR